MGDWIEDKWKEWELREKRKWSEMSWKWLKGQKKGKKKAQKNPKKRQKKKAQKTKRKVNEKKSESVNFKVCREANRCEAAVEV